MRVAAVIVTHDNATTVLRTVASVRRASSGLNIDWLVVDSGSSDETAELVEAEAGIEVLRVANRGFAAGLNLGMRRVAAELVVALNPDLEIIDGQLRDVVAAFVREPRLGIVGCPARRPDGTWLPTRGRRPSPMRHWAEALGAGAIAPCRRLAEMDVGPGPATWVAGSFLAIRARAAAEVGGLDERFFLYREETDWCLRFTEAGWRVRHLPLLELVHTSPEHSDPARAAQLARAKLQFAEKHFARSGAVSTRIALLTHHALRASLAPVPARRRAERAALSVTFGFDGPALESPRHDPPAPR